jgi:putative two-component system response regulator
MSSLDRRPRVLAVDDRPANLRLAAAMLQREGYDVTTATNGVEAIAAVTEQQPDLVLMDVRMPKLDGFETCRFLKEQASTRLIPIVLVTALEDEHDRQRGLEAGADDFVGKPFKVHELRARLRSLLRIKRYTDELESADAVILSLALTVEARDPCTEGHCQRLAFYASALGGALELPEPDITTLRRGGFLHDLGKIGIPDGILLKPAALTPAEFELMKDHTVIGDRLCGGLRSLERVRPIVRHHHERLDGSGYPDGLVGDDIPLLAQIVSVVDIFDALTTDRPYHQAISVAAACTELQREVRQGWRRADLVETFVDLVRRGSFPTPGGSRRPAANARESTHRMRD